MIRRLRSGNNNASDVPGSVLQRVLSSVDGPFAASVKLACGDDLSGCGHLSGLLTRR